LNYLNFRLLEVLASTQEVQCKGNVILRRESGLKVRVEVSDNVISSQQCRGNLVTGVEVIDQRITF